MDLMGTPPAERTPNRSSCLTFGVKTRLFHSFVSAVYIAGRCEAKKAKSLRHRSSRIES